MRNYELYEETKKNAAKERLRIYELTEQLKNPLANFGGLLFGHTEDSARRALEDAKKDMAYYEKEAHEYWLRHQAED
jgi:hypothetical protein